MSEASDPVIQTCTACGALIDVTDEEPFALMHCPGCGTAQRVRRSFDHFELQEVLGSGGMGAVYRALDTSLNRPVALKLLRKEYSADQEFVKQFEKEALGQIAQFLALIFVLLFLAIIISVLGIANTLALSIFERTREIGLLRAVGMSRVQTRGAVRWESTIVALLGALAGLGLGLAFGSAFVKAVGKDGSLRLALPTNAIGLVVLAVVVGLIASLWPARRAVRTDILRALTAE